MVKEAGRAANGDFHVVRMDGLFHVVFRPDSDPEWFRIIATFFTYERAYIYCDIERVSVWKWANEKGEVFADSATGDEEMAGLRPVPVHVEIPTGGLGERDGIVELVRGVYEGGEHVQPHPEEDFSEHPDEDEPPKDYHERQFQAAVAKQAGAPSCQNCGKPRSPGSAALCRDCYQGKVPAEDTPELTEKQQAVLEYFIEHANPLRLVNASYKQIAVGSRVANGSIGFLVETLERKGLIEIVERARGTAKASVFKLVPDKIADTAPAKLECP
jgi:hypothetical protein